MRPRLRLICLFAIVYAWQSFATIPDDCFRNNAQEALQELAPEQDSESEVPKLLEFDEGTVSDETIPARSLTPHEKSTLKSFQILVRRFQKRENLRKQFGDKPQLEAVENFMRTLHQEIAQFSKLEQSRLDETQVAIINPHFFKSMGTKIGPRATGIVGRLYYEALTEVLSRVAITPRRPNFRTFLYERKAGSEHPSQLQGEALKLFKEKIKEARETRDLVITDEEARFILYTISDPRMITSAVGPGPVVTTTLTRMMKIEPDLKATTDAEILRAYKRFAGESRKRYEKLLRAKSPLVNSRDGVSEEAIGIIRKIEPGEDRIHAYQEFFKKNGVEISDRKFSKQIEDFEKMVEFANVFEPPLSLISRHHPSTSQRLAREAGSLLNHLENRALPELETLSKHPEDPEMEEKLGKILDDIGLKERGTQVKAVLEGLDRSSFPMYIGEILENPHVEHFVMTYVDLRDIGNRTTKSVVDWVVTRQGTGSTLATALTKAEKSGDLSHIIESQSQSIRDWEKTVYKKIDHSIDLISKNVKRELNSAIDNCCEVSAYFTGDDIRIAIQVREVLDREQVELVKKALLQSHMDLANEGIQIRMASSIFKAPPHSNEVEARERIFRGIQTARYFGDKGLTEVVKPHEGEVKKNPSEKQVIMIYQGYFNASNGSWNFQPLNRKGNRVEIPE